MAGEPKAPFYAAVALVVVGLVGFAIYRADLFAPEAGNDKAGNGGDPIQSDVVIKAEDAAATGITTVDEYKFVATETLAPVEGTSEYAALEDNTVRFALNVWAGWAPIIYAPRVPAHSVDRRRLRRPGRQSGVSYFHRCHLSRHRLPSRPGRARPQLPRRPGIRIPERTIFIDSRFGV